MVDQMSKSAYAGWITKNYQEYKKGTPLDVFLPISLRSTQPEPLTGNVIFLKGLLQENAVAVAEQASHVKGIYIPPEYPFNSHETNPQEEKYLPHEFLFRMVHPPTIEQVSLAYRTTEINLLAGGFRTADIEARLPTEAFKNAVDLANVANVASPIMAGQEVVLFNYGLQSFVFWDPTTKSFCIAGGAHVVPSATLTHKAAGVHAWSDLADKPFRDKQALLMRLSTGGQQGGSCGDNTAFYFKVRKTDGSSGVLQIGDQVCLEVHDKATNGSTSWTSAGWTHTNNPKDLNPTCQTTKPFLLMPPWGTLPIPVTMYCSSDNVCHHVVKGAGVHTGSHDQLIKQVVSTHSNSNKNNKNNKNDTSLVVLAIVLVAVIAAFAIYRSRLS
jgi:hypothetical protein